MASSLNFSAGPSGLPAEVLQEAHEAFFDFSGSGMSALEISHRSEIFIEFAYQTEQDLRALLNIPDHYTVLFLQGGAAMQFSQVPLNLLRGRPAADYLHTGLWSGKAIEAARRYCTVRIAGSSEPEDFRNIPAATAWRLNPDAAYLHYTENETAHGVQFPSPPRASVPLVCDACSSLLTKPMDVAGHGLIYAAAQKNIGIAGVTVVIVDSALLGTVLPCTPDMLNYAILAQAKSLLNTPATFSWYLTGLTLKWLRRRGGLQPMHQANKEKAEALYGAIDGSDGFYINRVQPAFRSINNVPFVLGNPALHTRFLELADQAGFKGLKGHAAVGGIRASLYNAVSISSVDALVAFIKDFQRTHG